MAIDVMLIFVGIILGLFSFRIPYRTIAYDVAKDIEENLERGVITFIDPMVIIYDNIFRVIKHVLLRNSCKGIVENLENLFWKQNAKTNVEKDFYKLMNNANFGVDCRNDVNNSTFEPIIDEVDEISY